MSHSYLSAYQGVITIPSIYRVYAINPELGQVGFFLDNSFDPHHNFVMEMWLCFSFNTWGNRAPESLKIYPRLTACEHCNWSWTQAVWLQSPPSTGSPSHSFCLWLELWAWQISGKITFFISQDVGRSKQMSPWYDRFLSYFRDDFKALLFFVGKITIDCYCNFRWNNLPSIPNLKFLVLQPSKLQPYMHTCIHMCILCVCLNDEVYWI